MSTTKVLITTSELYGGSASYVVQLAAILKGNGNDVIVAFHPNERYLETEMQGLATKVVPFRSRFRSIGGFIGNMRALYNVVRTETPAVIYTNTVFPMVVVGLLRVVGLVPKRIRIVHTLHSFFFDKFRSPILRNMAMGFERLMGLCVDRVIAPSEYMSRLGKQIYKPANVIIIRNSLSERLERDLLEMRTARRKRILQKPYTLLFVGRADRQKGLDVLVKAFTALAAEHDVRLQIAGPTIEEYQAEYGLSCVDTGGIDFLGWVQNTADLYLNADAFVMPSRWEAFGLTLLEARTVGLPCVGSRVDAIPELIPPGSGVTVAPDSVDELVRGIISVIHRLPDFVLDPMLDDLPSFAQHRSAQLALLASLVPQ